MTQLKPFIIILLMLFNFGYGAFAQGLSQTPYEGSIHSYTCNGITEGSSYTFYVTADIGGKTGEYDFIGGKSGIVGNDGTVTAQIQWNTGSSINQFELWLEVNSSGCSNQIFIGVSPQPNNRSIGFDEVASTDCFNLSGNNFAISFKTKDNNGQPIPAAFFPLQVEFTVNGNIQSQLVTFNEQMLKINETMFAANPQENTTVVVEISKVTDTKNSPVKPGDNSGVHARTIFAIPEIEFTEELRKRFEAQREENTAYNFTGARGLDLMEPNQNY